MLRWFFRRAIDRLERRVGVSVEYLRHLADVSPRVLFKLMLIGPAGSHRQVVPQAMLHTVRLVTTMAEDCGACVQIAVNLARQDGVAPDVLRSVFDGNTAAMPDDIALAFQFANSILQTNGADEALRQQVRDRFGDAGLAELSLAIAMSRVLPTLKRCLGYATACQRAAIRIVPE